MVEKGQEGFSANKIQGKYSLRMVQNAHMKFENVFIPSKNKLTKALDFEKSAGRVLLSSRLSVGFAITG